MIVIQGNEFNIDIQVLQLLTKNSHIALQQGNEFNIDIQVLQSLTDKLDEVIVILGYQY